MTDSENHIFEPDVVLASEFFTPPSALPDPERALMIAVLEEAARCYTNYGNAADRKLRVLHEEARDWFASEDRSYLFAFENVCDVLGIDPAWLRRRVLALRDRRRPSSGSPQRSDVTTPPDDARAAG